MASAGKHQGLGPVSPNGCMPSSGCREPAEAAKPEEDVPMAMPPSPPSSLFRKTSTKRPSRHWPLSVCCTNAASFASRNCTTTSPGCCMCGPSTILSARSYSAKKANTSSSVAAKGKPLSHTNADNASGSSTGICGSVDTSIPSGTGSGGRTGYHGTWACTPQSQGQGMLGSGLPWGSGVPQSLGVRKQRCSEGLDSGSLMRCGEGRGLVSRRSAFRDVRSRPEQPSVPLSAAPNKVTWWQPWPPSTKNSSVNWLRKVFRPISGCFKKARTPGERATPSLLRSTTRLLGSDMYARTSASTCSGVRSSASLASGVCASTTCACLSRAFILRGRSE
mmetsp:Transcript_131149/g.280512  ORF Transcript_131149/g.280512 Transcript_131149/m.280512 type:complete len:334 (+) Transcript_131149:305-1306(+)